MLKAINIEKNEILNLLENISRESLKSLREKYNFVCPVCRQKVKLRIGEIIIPHFAHEKKSDCIICNESHKHLEGKKRLLSWLKKQNIKCDVEVRIPKINRIADILCSYKKQTYAIEYQCSKIGSEEVENRTKDYLKVKITPIWIVGDKPSKDKVTNFELNFCSENHIVYFEKMFYIKHLFANISKSKFVYDTKIYYKNEISFEQLLKKQFSFDLTESDFQRAYQEKFLESIEMNKNYLIKYNRSIAKLIYENKLVCNEDYIFSLKAFKNQYILDESPLVWQLLFKKYFLEIKDEFTHYDVKQFFKKNFNFRKAGLGERKLLNSFVYDIINKLLNANAINYCKGKFKVKNKNVLISCKKIKI